MKRIVTALATALTLGAGAPAQAAPDGTITFTGEIDVTSCVVSANNDGFSSGTPDTTVTLADVSADELNVEGARAGAGMFFIVVGTAAEPCLQERTQVLFHNKSNINAEGRLKNNGTAKNVEVVMQNFEGQDIDLTNNDNSPAWPIGESGTTRQMFRSQYYATGQATGGTVSTAVEYTVVYP